MVKDILIKKSLEVAGEHLALAKMVKRIYRIFDT
jgi:hypothetical protein